MAQLIDGSVEIVSRDDGRILSQVAAGNSNNTILLNQPSIVKIHGTRAMVTEFERQGNDLIVHMRDGSVKRYQQFFFDDVDGDHSELVFDDGVNPPEHALFPVTSEFADAQTAMAITPEYESLGSLDPLLLADTGATTGVVTAAGIGALGLGAAGIAALANGGGGGGGGDDTPAATPPTLTVNPFTGDNTLSLAEKNSDQVLNGSTTGAEAGNTVTVVLNGVTYTTTVGADGSWSITVPAAALAALPDGSNSLTVSVTNNAGFTTTTGETITVEAGAVTPTTPSIAIAAFAGDDVLDNGEQQLAQTISGTTTNVPQGQTVTVTLNGQTYSATVDGSGAWSVSVPAAALQALAAGTATIAATVTDAAGTAASTTHDFTVNAAATVPTIAIAAFAGDDVLDNGEQQLAQTISGTTTNVPQGQTVTVTLNGQTYSATVDGSGAWSVSVPAAALQALAAGTATIAATVTDAAGTAASATHDFTVSAANASSISVGELGGDGYLSIGEAQSDLTVSGVSAGLPAGTVIQVTLGGRAYSATVANDGSWSTTIPAADLQQLSQGPNLLIASATLADGTVIQNSSAASLNVVTTEPSAGINVPFGDSVLSGSEAAVDQTLTGNTGIAGAGQTVTATVGGTDYTGTVNNDGSWSVSIPADALQNLPQGSNDITVVVTDPAGNSSTSTTPVNVVTDAPPLTITPPPDTILNQSDVNQPLILSGVSSGSQTVAVTLNGVTYPTPVNPDGSWSVNIPASDLQQISDGEYVASVVATDSYGNTNTQTLPLTVDVTPPTATVDTLSGDGYVNAAEALQPLTITGTTQPGSSVLVRFDSVDLTATVDPVTGVWTATLSPDDQAGIVDGTYVVTVIATDPSGNTGQTYSKVTFATTTPVISVDPLTDDGALNAAEVTVDQVLTGTVTDVDAGRPITLTLADGTTYDGTIEPGGSWSITLPAATLAALANGTQNYSIAVSDAAGNTGNATGSFDVAVDNTTPALVVAPISGDNALNATEAQADLVISGGSAGLAAATPLTVTFNGVDYASAVNADGSWSVTVPAAALADLANGSYSVTVTGTDADSNPVTSTSDLTVRTAFPAEIIVNSPFGDGILNAAESTVAQTLTGNSGVNFADQAVTVTVDGIDYAATVDTFTGDWSVALLPPALESLQDGTANIVVTVTDSLGNTATTSTPFTVDTAAPALAITTVGDGVINGQTQNQPLAVTGTAEAGSTIRVALDGVNYVTAADADGNWSVNIAPSTLQTLGDGKYDITVTATDAGGNQTTALTPVVIDTAAPALTVAPISGDGYLNATEHAADLSVTGTADAGSAVVVSLNGVTYNATTDASGNWSVSVPASDINALPDGSYSVGVQATDSAGNAATVQQPLTVVAAATSLPAITVAAFTGDGVLDGAEKDLNQLVTGTTTNVQAGQVVTLTMNGQQYTGTVQADGSYSVLVPATAYYELANGAQTFTVDVADVAGNPATATGGYTIDDTFSAIAIGTISDDNAISAAEAQNPLVIYGSTRFVAFGARILVRFNNTDYETTANSDGSWSITVPASALSGLPNGNQTVTATATDASGNLITTTQTLDSAVNPDFTVTLNEPFVDGTLNGAEAAVDQQLTGTTGISGSGQAVSIVLNGITYTATVDTDGNWSVTLPNAVLQGLPQGDNTLTVTATDPAGNTSSLTNTFAVDTSTPTLTLDAIADDNRLNLAEQGQPLTITGTGEEGDVVTLVLNNATYTATVDGTGTWSVDLPATALLALTDGSYNISVNMADAAGNTVSLIRTLDVDLTPPPVTVNTVSTDGYLNAAEASQPLVISGTGETGGTVNVGLNDATYSVIVGADGQWTLTVPASAVNALADGSYTVNVTAIDPAGNSSVTSTPLVVDTSAPTIAINDFTENNILDGAEQQTDQLLSGTVANAEAGQPLTVTLNGVEYATTLQNGGAWQITIPAADLAGLANGTQTLSVTVTDLAGNAATTDKTFTVDNTLSSVAFNPLSEDGYLNAAEAQADLTVSGSTANVAEGSTVIFTLGGQNYTGTVAADGSWTVTVPAADLQALAEGPQTATASVEAQNGATVTNEGTLNIYVDRLPEPTLQTPFVDGILTNEEAALAQTLSGTTGQQGDGQTVTVTLGGVDYAATVNSAGNWTLELSPAVLQALPQGDSTVTVTATDIAGNAVTLTPAPAITVATALPTLTLDPVAGGDNIINADEQGAPLAISGTGTNGDGVTVTLNGVEYTTTVDADGNWSVTVPAADLAALADGPYALQVSASDAFGNTTTQNIGLAVDTAAPAFTVDPVTGDDTIDRAEQGQAQDITGTGSEGDTIAVTLGGETFTTTVPAGGQWTVSIPASALANLTEGDNTLTVTATSPAGNATSQESTLTLDTAVDVNLIVNAVTGDNLISAAEAAQGFAVTGSVPDSTTAVVVTFNGTDYPATVAANGLWSAAIPASALAGVADGDYPLTVTASPAGGGSLAQPVTLTLDTSAPTLTIAAIADDNLLNAAEQAQPLAVTGTGEAGDSVRVTLNGSVYNATVDGDGNWTVTVPATDTLALADGSYPVTVTATDAAGNATTQTSTLTVDLNAPALTVNPLSGDGLLNAEEQAQPLTVSGTAENGATVTVTLEGTDYTATAGANGQWSLAIPATDLAGLTNGDYTLTVAAADAAGNVTTRESTLTVVADADTLPTLTLDNFAGNNILDGAEQQVSQELSGTTTNVQAGQVVTVNLNGTDYTGLVQASGAWSVTIPAAVLANLPSGTQNYSVSVGDAAGNPVTATGSFDVTTDISAVAINPISDDGYLNATEAQSDLTLSGSVSNVPEGNTVTVTLNGVDYTTTVTPDGWSLTIPAADLAALPDGPLTVSASVPDAGGNAITSEATLNVAIATLPVVTVETPFTDGTLNADEAATAQTLTGTTGVTGDGQNVSVVINGSSYFGTVDGDGNWSILLPPEALQALPQGDTTATVAVSDAAGNSATSPLTLSVDTLPPVVTVNPVAGDNILNATEQAADLSVSGTSEANAAIVVSLNGTDYTTTAGLDGSWTLAIPAADLAALADGDYVIATTASDTAGNSASTESPLTVKASEAALPTITIDPFASDDTLTGAEQLTTQYLSGTTTNVEAGQQITATLNGVAYSASVLASGAWRVAVPSSALAALADGTATFSVSVSDAAGNPVTASRDFTVDGTAAGISLDPLSGDGYLNAAEAQDALIVTGSTAGVAQGATVTVTFNDQTFTGVTGAGGAWNVVIPASSLAGLADGANTLTASVTDASGATTTSTATLNVQVNNLPAATADAAFNDGVLNGVEAATDQTLTGSTGVTGDGQTVTVAVGDTTYTGVVDADGNWSVSIPAADLQALPQGSNSLQVTVADAAGNTGTVAVPVTVDTAAPTLTLDAVAGDGVVNATEAAAEITVSGGSTGAEEGQTVTVSLNGQSYTTAIAADGSWSLALPAGLLQTATDGTYPLTVTLNDAAGNTASAGTDITLSTASLQPTLDTAFIDNYLNAAEAQSDQTLSGTSGATGAGQSVTVNIAGTDYAATVDNDGNWTLPVSAETLQGLAEGIQSITVTATNAQGNTGTTGASISVDYTAPTLAITPVAGDNIINAAESVGPVAITGTASASEAGQLVTVTFNGVDYQQTVQNDGSWTVNLPSSVTQGIADGTYAVSASLTDAAGNVTTQDVTVTVLANPASLPTLTPGTVAGDNYVNQAEAGADVAITGSTTNVPEGQTVTVTLNGVAYTAAVQADGTWTTTVPSADIAALDDGAQIYTVTVADVAGNAASASGEFTLLAQAASLPTVTINPIANDDVINAQEVQGDIQIAGTSQNIAAGDNVTVTLNGATYTGTVDDDGNWTATIPAADVQALGQGVNTLTASGNDVAGNTATGTTDFTVDTAAPALAVELSAGADNALNAAEAAAGLTVSGTTDAGLPVSVTLNDKTYAATADADGAWSLTIPSGDLAALSDGTTPLTVAVTDTSGNVATSVTDLTVAINALPTLTLNAPFTDGLLNAAEAATEQTLSGTATNLAEGTAVTVTIGDQTFNGTVGADSSWSVTVPADTLTALADGIYPLTVASADAAGNPATAQASVEVLTSTLPTVTIATPFVDGLLNAAEAGVDQVISGTTGITGTGQTLTLDIDGTSIAATVDESGNWTATLTPEVAAALGNGEHTISATAVDIAGNSNTGTLAYTAIVTGLPAPTLAQPFTDGALNATEAAAGQTLSGTTGITGAQTVSVDINGTAYQATVDPDTGNWTLALGADVLTTLPDGTLPVTVTATDAVGNAATATDSVVVAVNTLPSVTIDLPFTDGLLNVEEAATTQTLSGNTGLTAAGQTVTVTVDGGTPLDATVNANGNWSLDLTSEQLTALSSGTHTFAVTATDSAGNASTTTLDFDALLSLPQPTISEPLFTDGILNIAEAGAAITLTGTTGVTGANQGVQLQIDVAGITYTGTVDADGNWAVALPAGALSALDNGAHTVDVTVIDAAGNVNTSSLGFTAALTAPTPTLDVPFDDTYLNAADVAAGASLTGTTGLAGDGQTVAVTLGGTNYNAVVDADGNWTLALTPAQLGTLGQGVQNFTVSASDAGGNTAAAAGSFTVDTSIPTVTITPFTGDGALDYEESLTTQTLSGTTTGVEAGQTVTVTLGTATLTGVVAADGSWSVNLTPADLAQLGATGDTGTISATVADVAGNPATATAAVAVDLTPPATPLLTLDPVSDDNIVNSADGATLTLSGTYANLPATGGAVTGTVSVTINGVAQTATATVDSETGAWTLTVPNTTDNIAEGTATVVATLTTDQGTTLTTSSEVLVDRVAPTVTINAFTDDDTLNSSEAAATQTISGTASTSEAGRAVTLTLNDKTYSAVVQADGSWSTTVPSGDLQALGQDTQTISATLTDAAGNIGTVTRDFTVDTAAPLIQVDALLGDNLLNAADILVTQVLTGTATGAEGETIGLYLGDSSPIATAVVAADGTFSLDLTPEVLGSLTDGTLVFGLRVSDPAGNATEATLTVNKVVNQALNLVVDSVFGDGFLNATDTTVAQTITGLATSAGIGATVSLTLGGTTLTANVGQDGRFALVVPPSLLGLLSDGDTSLDIVLTDAAGNTRTVGETVTTILEAPVINALTGLFGGDNLLNIAEAAVAQTVSGTVDGVAGSTVTVTLGSKSYQTTLQADGAWSVSIPALDLSALTTGNQTLGVSVTDPAGNTSATSATIGIFTAQPSITLNPIFGDGVLNIADALVNQTISGTVNNVAAGTTINLTLGSSTVQATVGQNGAFTATVTPDILATLTSGNLTVGASVTDAAGNTASATGNLVAKLTAPVVSIAQLFGDGLLNAADAALGQTISGTVTNAGAGSRVVVTVAGTQLVTTTAADGSYSVALTPTILKGLADGNLTVGVSVTDSAGNTSSATAGAIVGVNTLPTVTLNPVFGGDGILNLAESLVTQTISGTATNVAQGSTVTISLGNTTVTATVGANGAYSAQVTPAILSTLLDGNLTVGVSVTDAVGNTASTSTGVRVGIQTTPSLTVNTVFGDSVLSANDINTVQTISGTTRNVPTGSTVTVTLNGKTYTAAVNSSGGWTLNVPKADLSALANGILTINASVTDSYGNVATNTGQLVVIAQTPPTVTVSSIFGDGLLSAADAQNAQTISGSSTNAEGSILTVRVGTATLTTTIGANGTWSVSVPAATLAALPDGTTTVTASVTNAVGNTGSGTDTATVKTHTLPTVAITSSTVFGGDHYLNLSEANVAETISGTSTNAVGSTVSVNLAGNTFTTTVGANGAWSVTIPSATLKALADGSYTITATVTDAVGNTSTGSDTFTAKINNLPAVGVDPITSLVNVLLTGLTVTGGTLNLAQGSTVRVTLNGTTQTATTDALGRYSVKFTGGALTALDLNSRVTVAATDVAGNATTTTTTLLLGSLLATSTAAAAMVSVAAEDGTTAAAAETSDTSTTSNSEAVATTRIASTESSESESTTTSNSTENTTTDTSTTDDAATANAAVVDESDYTIGGVVVTLADGNTVEGASVEGSSGSDTVTLNTLNFTHIDGGAGTDTLVLNGENMTLDLTALGLKVEHIEIINLGSSGTNSVKLDLNEALNITDKQTDDLIIKGVTGDQVTLANGDGGTWATTAQRTVDGQVFDVYHNSALDAANTLGDVLIQHNLQVHLV